MPSQDTNSLIIYKTSYVNTVAIRPSNNFYSVIRNQPKNNYYTIIKNKNGTTNNYYVISMGNYFKTAPWAVSQPTPQPIPEPQPTLQRPQPAPQPAPDSDIIPSGKHSLTAEEIQMVNYVNKARQDAGLQPLQIDLDLSYVARLKSQDMNDNNYFSHDSPRYGSPFDMMTKFEIKYSGAAENIAKNSNVASAHNAFMKSQGHKNNILNPIYTHIGVGIHNGYYTQMFIRK